MSNWLIKLACWWYAGAFNRKRGYVAGRDNILDWRLVYAVAQHESGNFTSSLFKRANNCFGMRVPTKRKWYGIGEDNNYSVYSSPWNSVRDYFSWCDYVGMEVSQSTTESPVDSWTKQMKDKNYYGATFEQYSNGVQYFYDTSMNLKSPSLWFAWALPMSVIIIWNRKQILAQVKKLTKSK